MKITLLVVGRTIKGWITDGLDIYKDRLSHYVNFEMKEIVPQKLSANLSKDEIKLKEGELILKNLRHEDRVILLDERGEERSSLAWAEIIRKQMVSGKDIVYVIGGAYGFSQAVYDRADGKISLSKMTFSHQMVRVIFTEQLYRAFTIINGEPYHHE